MVRMTIRPRSETDIITDFESVVGGSNPPEGTKNQAFGFCPCSLVVKQLALNQLTRVRFLPGAPTFLCVRSNQTTEGT